MGETLEEAKKINSSLTALGKALIWGLGLIELAVSCCYGHAKEWTHITFGIGVEFRSGHVQYIQLVRRPLRSPDRSLTLWWSGDSTFRPADLLLKSFLGNARDFVRELQLY